MSERFDWRTDEEDWADEPVVVAREATAVSRPFARKKAALVFILFAVATGIVYWQLGKRAKATQEAITTEIELTHELVRQADAAQDEELFWSFLSGRDPAWMEWQNELAKEGR
jgi:hypothetical protein